MLSFYLFFGIVYALLIRSLELLWRIPSSEKTSEMPEFSVSIITAYRNEAQNLESFLESVLAIRYRPLELVMVNDHSEDRGRELAALFGTRFLEQEISFVHADSDGQGKKAAIQVGVQASSGEIIVSTDADCRLSANWVAGMLRPFADRNIHMVCGPVMTSESRGFFQVFQQIEWASVLLVSQAGFALGNPIMCSAANLAYRRDSFVAVSGFEGNEHIPTGDDEFLMKKFLLHFGNASIKYLLDESLLVKTQAHESWGGLLQQRIRWASKWRGHGSLVHSLASVGPLLVTVTWISSFLLFSQGWWGLLVLLAIWTLKIGYEQKALGKVLEGFSVRHGSSYFWLTSLLHPWYVLAVGLGTVFFNYTWKGRKYPAKQ